METRFMPNSTPETDDERNGLVVLLSDPPTMTEEQAKKLEAKRRAELVIRPEERMTADELRQRMDRREAAKEKPDSVEYQHSLLCALALPRSRQESREYRREWQGRSLVLEAGSLWNGNDWIPQPLPYGPKARLAFMHICTEAVKLQGRYIETESSARAFMQRIGIGDGGNHYRLFRQQMNALAEPDCGAGTPSRTERRSRSQPSPLSNSRLG